MRLAILDDYQGVALGLADWASLAPAVSAVPIRDVLPNIDAAVKQLADFEIVVAMRERTPFPSALIERLPKLKLLVTTGMRNASIDVKAALERGIAVCGTDMLPYPTAELAWGLILSLARSIPREMRNMREGRWQTTVGVGLRGKTLGVVGLGRLGSEVAKIGKAFGMELIAWSENLTPERAAAVGAERVGKDELIRRADFVTIHLVLSERTRGLVGASELAAMKSTAYLVNTSRGPIVDTSALIAALELKRIAGAAIDVYDTEPLPADHPLRRLENAVLTPHIGYVIAENYRLAYGQAVVDVRGFLAGKLIREVKA
ncbi:MAG TPA: D-2-hydroxyacid dehydrogenase family protein [Alphaproteobacteria bacterium]